MGSVSEGPGRKGGAAGPGWGAIGEGAERALFFFLSLSHLQVGHARDLRVLSQGEVLLGKQDALCVCVFGWWGGGGGERGRGGESKKEKSRRLPSPPPPPLLAPLPRSVPKVARLATHP